MIRSSPESRQSAKLQPGILAWERLDALNPFNYRAAGLNEFVDLVIPELQSRGLFRSEFEGPMLRDNLGLRRPVSRYAAEPFPR